jgi:hypothetical protein
MAEAGSRTFYGGEPLMGAAGGEISTGKYDGPEAHEHAPWKCPACGVTNEGELKFGCVHCGSGKPGRHVGQPPAAEVERRPGSGRLHGRPLDDNGAIEFDPPPAQIPPTDVLQAIAHLSHAWAETNEHATLAEAFQAGYRMALQQTMKAAPVTVDVRELAPHTKAQRTIIAALEIFKDQILSQEPEEIASGEWMSVYEVDQLLVTLRAQL